MENRLHQIIHVFCAFLKLGCIAFGGPVAHLGFFRDEFVAKRQWLADKAYADLVALCQFLPGPASSQVGFALGVQRAGVLGGFAAWTGFTLPSAVLMIGFALGISHWGSMGGQGWIHGLKLAAVAVVAHALWNMAAKLCPDRSRALIAIGCAAFLVVVQNPWWQIGMIVLGLILGGLLFRNEVEQETSEAAPAGNRKSIGFLWAFLLLLALLPIAVNVWPAGWLMVMEAFYRAGSLVFGGGHVVLPLLDSFTVGRGWTDQETFLAGYGAAQALPGPLFAFSAYLGSVIQVGPGGVLGGVLGLLSIYLPSWLLVLGVMPYWERIRRVSIARAMLMGANAAVVGLLLAAFYLPVFVTSVTSSRALAFALVGFGLLRFAKLPPWALVVLSGVAGWLWL